MEKLTNKEIISVLKKQINRKNQYICEVESDNNEYEDEIAGLRNDHAKSLELNERYLTIITNMSER